MLTPPHPIYVNVNVPSFPKAMAEVTANPVDPTRPLRFSVLRVPFFLEPEYTTDEDWEETNRTRLWRKWGGEASVDLI